MNGNRFAAALALGLTLLAGCSKPADPPSDRPANPPLGDTRPNPPVITPEPPEGKKPDAQRTGPSFSEVLEKLEDAKRSRAQHQCITLSRASDAYRVNPANPDGNPPMSPKDLLAPPFGGPPFLLSANDLKDPWGNEFKMELRTRSDDTDYLLFSTTARDGTEISQFGIGTKARPKDDQPPKK